MSNFTTKKGFILYHDLSLIFHELTDEQAGQLIKYIVNYSVSKTQVNPTEPTGLFGLLNAVSKPFINHIDWDFQRWQKVCEKNRNNGKKGGRKKEKEPKRTQVKPIIDNREQIIDNKIKEKDKKEITIDDFSDFIEKENLDKNKVAVEIEICFDWYKSKGRVLKDKKAAFRNWIRKDLQKFKIGATHENNIGTNNSNYKPTYTGKPSISDAIEQTLASVRNGTF